MSDAASFDRDVGPLLPGAGAVPRVRVVLEFLKPVTWFPPMWAFLCGAVSSGVPLGERWPLLLAGIVLAGPLVCAMSQAVNDWHDRHVDAINEPDRPIPSGRLPGRWGYAIAWAWTVLSLFWALLIGPWVALAAIVGIAMAWAYSAPPLRLKRDGWSGALACAVSYEGLAWFTGAAVMLGALPSWPILTIALLYSLGAHGIMTLNDFKSVEGDRTTGVRSLPVRYGDATAARLAAATMAAPQLVVILLLLGWGAGVHAGLVALLLVGQAVAMVRLLLRPDVLRADPRGNAARYNATGVLLFVSGMMITAHALGGGLGVAT